ncbi:hypothetical protein V5799_010293 [Amblyomma americanum]|uniref:Uncharacterized protein n=1 Tax=Amblyomma americanum TaxID=6943 RepID=A0AAQ4F9M5_AMBAM
MTISGTAPLPSLRCRRRTAQATVTSQGRRRGGWPHKTQSSINGAEVAKVEARRRLRQASHTFWVPTAGRFIRTAAPET